MSDPVSQHPCQHFRVLLFVFLISLSDISIVTNPWGFNLHFPIIANDTEVEEER